MLLEAQLYANWFKYPGWLIIHEPDRQSERGRIVPDSENQRELSCASATKDSATERSEIRVRLGWRLLKRCRTMRVLRIYLRGQVNTPKYHSFVSAHDSMAHKLHIMRNSVRFPHEIHPKFIVELQWQLAHFADRRWVRPIEVKQDGCFIFLHEMDGFSTSLSPKMSTDNWNMKHFLVQE